LKKLLKKKLLKKKLLLLNKQRQSKKIRPLLLQGLYYFRPMKYIMIMLLGFGLVSACSSKSNLDEPFITNHPEELEKYASKALQQAQFKLDSLRKTELLQEKSPN